MRVPIRLSRPSRFPRLSTRRIIALVALSAIVARGLQGGYRPGWHVGLPATGLRVGACRDDLGQITWYGSLEPGARSYLIGAWDTGDGPGRPGYLRFGLRCHVAWGVPAGRWSVHGVGPGGETVAW